MINVKTLQIGKNVENSFQRKTECLEQYEISNQKFSQMMKEAQDDIENERLHTHNEIMNVGLEVLENRMSDLSQEEQKEARKFIRTWRNIFESQI